MHMGVYWYACACIRPLGAVVQAIMNHHTWVLGTKFRSSLRTASDRNY